jgi:hypothetical protein
VGTNGKDTQTSTTPSPQVIPLAQREADAIYQKDRYGNERVVARVKDVEVDEAGKEILFGEVSQSDDLSLPDECEYQKWVVEVRKIAYSTKEDKSAPNRGRVLRGVTAEILRRVEQ